MNIHELNWGWASLDELQPPETTTLPIVSMLLQILVGKDFLDILWNLLILLVILWNIILAYFFLRWSLG